MIFEKADNVYKTGKRYFMHREPIINKVLEKKITIIMREMTQDQLLKTVEAMKKGEIGLVQVSFEQSGMISGEQTVASIKLLSDAFDGKSVHQIESILSKLCLLEK